MTRQEAIRAGLGKYTSTKPCPRGHLRERYTRSCSCVQCHLGHYSQKHWQKHDRRKKQAAYYEKRVTTDPAAIFYHTAKARAKELGIKFDISIQDVRDVWPADSRCPALGILMIRNVGGSGADNSPSLDRIVPSKGYVRGNIAVISLRANKIKQDEVDPRILRRVADWLEKVRRTP